MSNRFDEPMRAIRRYTYGREFLDHGWAWTVRIEGYDSPAIAAEVDAVFANFEPVDEPGFAVELEPLMINRLREIGCKVERTGGGLRVQTNRRPAYTVLDPG